jgi:dTDP-4-dehydrorhamnose 3,5-epimerase
MSDLQSVGIEGAWLKPLVSHRDDRGAFTECYRREFIPGMREMLQANLSVSRAGALRGSHFHTKQTDYWTLITGTITVGLYDLRTDSPTHGLKAELEWSAHGDPSGTLYIPPGVTHGWYAQTDAILHYLVDQYHDPADEFGVAWDDPDVGIDWKIPAGTEPILSERDRSNPSLSEVLRGSLSF